MPATWLAFTRQEQALDTRSPSLNNGVRPRRSDAAGVVGS